MRHSRIFRYFAVTITLVAMWAGAQEAAMAQGRGGGGGGRGGGGGGGASRGGGVDRSAASANRSANTNQNANVNRNVNRNAQVNQNVNVNRNVNVDVDNHGVYRPLAAAAVVTAGVAVTAAAVGSMVYSIPPSCAAVAVNGITYQQCGSTWYQPQYAGTQVTYMVVNPP